MSLREPQPPFRCLEGVTSRQVLHRSGIAGRDWRMVSRSAGRMRGGATAFECVDLDLPPRAGTREFSFRVPLFRQDGPVRVGLKRVSAMSGWPGGAVPGGGTRRSQNGRL